jgi:hypothetical protein
MEAGRDHGIHRLACFRERDGDVEEELAGRRIGDDGSLIADDEIVEPSLLEVRTHGAEHPSGDDHDMRAGRPRPRERVLRPRPQDAVLGDQRAVEVERESCDVRRKRGRKLYGALPPVESTT